MASLKGTQTEQNILTAFAGESQARNRYTYFASKAKKDGYELVAAVFAETAGHEKEHAERLFKMLEGGEVEISASFPAGKIGTTLENLKASAAGEHHEASSMYPDMAAVARKEGFEGVARVFESITSAEQYHMERYLKLAELIETETMFKKDTETAWKCRNCGYIHVGTEAPAVCPACAHAQSYFEEKCC